MSYQQNPYGQQNPYDSRPSNQESYGQYGGNPYASEGYGQQQQNPYGGGQGQTLGAPHQAQQPGLSQQTSGYLSNYENPSAPVTHQNTATNTAVVEAPRAPPMSNQDFLARVDAVRRDINSLSSQVSSIATIHQRAFSSPDSNDSSAGQQQLASVTADTQVLNARIRDAIRALEVDAARGGGGNATKDSQVRSLKASFRAQLEQFRKEEQEYGQRFRDQIKRQYRIVNPDATEEEVQEAAEADWGNEGVFQTALKANRAGHASSVLGAVRARHRDIQQIEKTLIELNQLFSDLAEAVVVQEPVVQAAEEQTSQVKGDTEAANAQLTRATASARRARKLKWWCLGITVLIILILALVLGLFFGLHNKNNNN